MEQTTPEDGVTGVSRSGRVRKKSRKLTDFTIEDEIRVNKKSQSASKEKRNHNNISSISGGGGGGSADDHSPLAGLPAFADITAGHGAEMMPMPPSGGASYAIRMEETAFSGDDEASYSESRRKSLLQTPTGPPTMHPIVPKRSLYMTEKSSKKQKLLKDGTIVLSKAQRKDKGKPRFTAYMLWSKEARQQIMASNPDIDFASASKRLGEMWANVPGNQKYQWKKKAKRLQTKIKKNTAKQLAAEQAAARTGAIKPMSASIARRAAKRIESENQLQQQVKSTPVTNKREAAASASSSSSHRDRSSSSAVSKSNGVLKPVEIAAHLKLLGDSLETIGQRLKEHEGQITVSGSLSVLLDTLLCSLGPLVSLTYYIPNLGDRLQACLRPSTQATLDNIAYLMPGL